jgi:hypothetical protein
MARVWMLLLVLIGPLTGCDASPPTPQTDSHSTDRSPDEAQRNPGILARTW